MKYSGLALPTLLELVELNPTETGFLLQQMTKDKGQLTNDITSAGRVGQVISSHTYEIIGESLAHPTRTTWDKGQAGRVGKVFYSHTYEKKREALPTLLELLQKMTKDKGQRTKDKGQRTSDK